jgi:tetratricopeptide (TPR) repeat protein
MGKSIDWTGRRAIRVLLVLVVVVTIGFIGSYVWDNYFRSTPSLLDRTIEHLEELVRANPGDPEVRVAVAEAYLANGMYQEAITQYNETLKLLENHQGALFGLGSAYFALSQDNEAINYFNTTLVKSIWIESNWTWLLNNLRVPYV